MLASLLERGYFPKELPRPFNTVSYAITLSSGGRPRGWDSVRSGKAANYSLARVGIFRRPLAVCNPIHFYGLASELTQNWSAISPLVAGTPLSATTPVLSATGRALQGRDSLRLKPKRAMQSRMGCKFVLLTDITRFYSSIYTHSIPWAVHTKKTAKRDRSRALLGNRLDAWVRQGQDQQTVGIPIGPDTSLVLAEIIMQRCDDELIKRVPSVKGYRYIDDYELGFWSRTEAEDAYHILESCLSEYELALNPKKTSVVELPLPLEPKWAVALKRFPIRVSKSGATHDLEDYFSLAFELHQTHPDESVLQYAIARLGSLQLSGADWVKLQQLLLLCVTPEPASFPYAIDLIIKQRNLGAPIIRREITDAVEKLIIDHSTLRHSSEVANAVWAALALRLRIGAKAVKALSRCDDPIVALLALDYRESGLCRSTMDTSLWQTYMTAEELYGGHWILAYEARIKDWLPSNDRQDHVRADSAFAALSTQNVSFYDTAYTRLQGGQSPRPRLPSQGMRRSRLSG